MASQIPGYHGVILEVDLTNRKVNEVPLTAADADNFIGGRGLGAKMLWDKIKKPGLDAMSPENPLGFMIGPFDGFPIPYASRFNVSCKSPLTSTLDLNNKFGSTIGYASCGGMFQTALRLTGYDSLIFTGKSESPVVVTINNGKVEFRDGKKYWGMKQYDMEKQLHEDLAEPGWEVAGIGPAAENGVRFCSVLHTLGRAAGRSGVGTVMGSKNLKAVAVKGNKMPVVADHKLFLTQLATMRAAGLNHLSRYGTSSSLVSSSDSGNQATKNYREATDLEAVKISGLYAEVSYWTRNAACYCCPQACKKLGVSRGGQWGKWVYEGPEYETGTLMGTNLLIHDYMGMMKCIGECDDWGMDQISAANMMGFLMECYEKGVINKKFLGGVDLKWGNVQGTSDVLKMIALRQHDVGQYAALGTKRLAEYLGKGTMDYAAQSKGQEYAAHRRATQATGAMGYLTSNRGACHLNSGSASGNNSNPLNNSLVICSSGSGTVGAVGIPNLLAAITGKTWDQAKYTLTGERIFNLEKVLNYRDGFRRADDEWVPGRFYNEPPTIGAAKGMTWDKAATAKALTQVYSDHGWDTETSKPSQAKLTQLGLDYAWKDIADL